MMCLKMKEIIIKERINMYCIDDVFGVYVKELLEMIIVIINIVKKFEEKYLNELVKLLKEFKFKFEKFV